MVYSLSLSTLKNEFSACAGSIVLGTGSLCSASELAQFGWDPCDVLCPPSASPCTGQHPKLFPVGHRSPSNLGKSDEVVSVSLLSAACWGTCLGCLQYSGGQMDPATLIFQGFLPSSGGFAYFFSISYNLGLLMDKDVAVSHHQKFLCQISLTETVFSATEIRSVNNPCWTELRVLSSGASTTSKI